MPQLRMKSGLFLHLKWLLLPQKPNAVRLEYINGWIISTKWERYMKLGCRSGRLLHFWAGCKEGQMVSDSFIFSLTFEKWFFFSLLSVFLLILQAIWLSDEYQGWCYPTRKVLPKEEGINYILKAY
jgi:hypothetical protein